MNEDKKYIVIPKYVRYLFAAPMIIFTISILWESSWSSIASSKPWGVLNLIMAFAIVLNVGGIAFIYAMLMICIFSAVFLMTKFDLGIIGWITPFVLGYVILGIIEKYNIVFDDDDKLKNRLK